VALARDPAVISVATDGVNGALLTLTTAKVAGAGKGKKAG
jgi:hypothetical protein